MPISRENREEISTIAGVFASEAFANRVREFLERYKSKVDDAQYAQVQGAFNQLIDACQPLQDDLPDIKIREARMFFSGVSPIFDIALSTIIDKIHRREASHEDIGVLSEVTRQVPRFIDLADGKNLRGRPGGGLYGAGF